MRLFAVSTEMALPVLFVVFLAVQGAVQRRTSPPCPPESDCDPSKPCSSVAGDSAECSGDWTVDKCGCCRECVRDKVGLPCGGPQRRGVCEAPLECVADVAVGRLADVAHEEGTCQERNCSSVVCPTTSSKSCPEDSYALPSLSSPQSCCPISQGCACLPSDCLSRDCPQDTVRQLLRKGNGKPGSCCNAYECVSGSGDGVCRVGKETYKNGETWNTKCSRCSCRNGVAICNDNVCKGVDVHCSWLHKPEGECCPVCLGCLTSSGFRFNNSERWKEDDCTWCECVSGKAKCETQMCQTKCANPVKQPGICCPICEKTSSSGWNTFHHGSSSTLNRTSVTSSRACGPEDRSVWRDQCRHCACLNGREVCSLVVCPRTYCEHPVMQPGSCCPVCQNDAASPFHRAPASTAICQGLDGHVHREGDSWWLDDCTQCVCIDGFALCDPTPCPPAPCAHPVRKQGQCCPVCNEDQLGGNHSNQLPCVGGFKDGESWRPEPCLSCLCRAGKERCFREACTPLTCLEPLYLKDRCCPICPAGSSKTSLSCRTDGKVYPDGASWSPDNCKRCHCALGQVQCSEMGCPPNLCRSADHSSGSCCVPCPEGTPQKVPAPWQCTLGSQVFADGEHRALDNCNRCHCDRGHLTCRETICHQDLCRTRNHTSGNCCTQCTELGQYTKDSSERVGFIVTIVILTLLLVAAVVYHFCFWRRKRTKKGFNKANQPFQKIANGNV